MGETQSKSYIITLQDLGELEPFFKSKMGKAIGRMMIKVLGVDKLNKIHAKYLHLKKSDFTNAILQDSEINVKYRVHGAEHLELMREIDAFYTVSNHPFGGLDGVILIDLVSRIRPDFMVLVNQFLNHITGLRDVWIPIQPRVNKSDYIHDASKNIYGLRQVGERIKAGHPVGMFPAGGVPRYDKATRNPKEQQWQITNTRILMHSEIPIFPIAFAGNNTPLYFKIGELFNYQMAALRLPAEIFRKRGEEIQIYVGEPIMPEELLQYRELKAMRDFVQMRTLSLLPK